MGPVVFQKLNGSAAFPSPEAKILSVAAQALCLLKALSDVANNEGSNSAADARLPVMADHLVRSLLGIYPDGNTAFVDLFACAKELGLEMGPMPITEVLQ